MELSQKRGNGGKEKVELEKRKYRYLYNFMCIIEAINISFADIIYIGRLGNYTYIFTCYKNAYE